MDTKNISTSMTPVIKIDEVLGNLNIKGWEEPAVEVEARSEDLNFQFDEEKDTVTLSCRSECNLRLPSTAAIQIDRVKGDARLKLLDEPVQIHQVNGSVILRSVAETSVEQVNGNLIGRQINGSVMSETINGNVQLRDLEGGCIINRVNGNLDLRFIFGSIQSEVNGNVRLRCTDLEGETYQIKARGNLNCEIPGDANLTLNITSNAHLIRIRLPENDNTYRQKQFDLTIGTGEKKMELAAGGIITISQVESDWEQMDQNEEDVEGFAEDFSERISQQIESQMEAMTRQLNEQLAQMSVAFSKSGMSAEEMERIMEQARESSERATERAQEKIRRAQEKMEKKLETHQRRTESREKAAERRAQSAKRRGWHFEWSSPPTPPVAATKPSASEEERLMILKMLEEKKISLDEATQLLEALESKVA
jgi:DUF4097 and DUF4098 domain-containing protein YvlB